MIQQAYKGRVVAIICIVVPGLIIKDDFELNSHTPDAEPLQKHRSARIASRGYSSSMEVPSNPAPRPTRSKPKPKGSSKHQAPRRQSPRLAGKEHVSYCSCF